MDDDRVKDPLGQYEETRNKAYPEPPMSDFGAIGRVIGVVALAALSVGLIVYGLFF